MSISSICTSKHQGIGIAYLLLLIGQRQEFLIYLVELLLREIHTVYVQTMLQGCTSATSSQYDAVVIDTNILRIHNLVSMHILQYTILMNTTGVRKGIATHYCLIRLYRHIHQR